MRISDYIGQASSNLWKKKLRTILTTSGVVIGIGALVCMFAFGQGVQRNITDQVKKLDLFNYIDVFPRGGPERPGESSDPDDQAGRRAEHRKRRGIPPVQEANQPGPRLDAQTLARIRALDGVEAAFPELRFPAQLGLGDKEEFTLVQVLPVDVCRSGLVKLRAGTCYAADANELVISDLLLHRLGLREPEKALGRKIQVATLTLKFSFTNLGQMFFGSGMQALPFARENYTFTIVGVTGRMGFGGPLPIQSDALIPPAAAAKMRKIALTSVWDLFAPSGGAANYSTVSVRVQSVQDVTPVKKEIEALGFRTFALMDQFDQMRIGFLIMDMILIAVGMIGITVASLGIVNTMVMSIMERYREIGIMKAVGATDGDVQRIFFFESGTIGLLGGSIGLGLGWAVSLIINTVVNILMARQGAPQMDYFNFPWWLCLGAIAFSIVVSLLAGIYPTRRAARVDPVVALRHD